jgi:hypothetical protein
MGIYLVKEIKERKCEYWLKEAVGNNEYLPTMFVNFSFK